MPARMQREGRSGSTGMTAAIDGSQAAPRWSGMLGLQASLGNRALAERAAAPGSMDLRLARLMGGTIQARRSELSAPTDPAEREADVFAERVLARRGGGERPMETVPRASVSRAADGAGGGLAPVGFDGALAQTSGGRTMPGGFRRHAEGCIGADFNDVRIHDGHDADELSRSIDARAFTRGSNIYFRRGEYDPGSAGGQRLLAHELTHVAQQRGKSSRRIHRVISVDGTTYAGLRLRGNASKSVQKAWTKIQASNYKPAGGWTDAHLRRLSLWITREAAYKNQVWMTQRNYAFANWAEAAEALDAELQAQDHRREEKALARTAKRDNPEIQNGLVAALRAIATWISAAYPGAVRYKRHSGGTGTAASVWAYLEGFRGQYSHWYPHGHVKQRMTSPVAKQVSSNFVMLREIVYALGSIRHVNVEDSDQALTGKSAHAAYDEGARYGTGPDGRVRIDKDDGHETRGDHFTPKAKHPWVKHARAKAMPLRAGASNTTDRILQMAGKAGVGVQGKQAIAWAGFIFWNTRYYNTISPPHTFHEIMDVANVNHGVPYNVDDPYKFAAAEAEDEAPVSQVPDYANQATVTLVDHTQQQQQPPPQAVAQAVDQNQFANLPPGPRIGRPEFVAGKTMLASKELLGALATQITFVEAPGNNTTELPLQMFHVLCTEQMRGLGRAQLVPAGFGDRSYFVALADLFDLNSGQIVLH